MLRRLALSLLAFVLMTSHATSADDVPKQAVSSPGTCFSYTVTDETGVEKDPAAAFVNRVDIQPHQFKVENKPIPDTRFRIGILLKNQHGPVPSDISAPCMGEGLAFNCTMKCADKIVGKFRAEALPTKPADPKANYLRLIIEKPTVINQCTDGQKPIPVPEGLHGLQVILKSVDASACFK